MSTQYISQTGEYFVKGDDALVRTCLGAAMFIGAGPAEPGPGRGPARAATYTRSRTAPRPSPYRGELFVSRPALYYLWLGLHLVSFRIHAIFSSCCMPCTEYMRLF